MYKIDAMVSSVRENITWYWDRLRLVKSNIGHRWESEEEDLLLKIEDVLYILDKVKFRESYLDNLMDRAQRIINLHETGYYEYK
jgi:hypothetical protein